MPVQSPAQRRAWSSFLRALVGRYGPDGRFWELLDSYIKVFYADGVDGARAMLASRFPPPGSVG